MENKNPRVVICTDIGGSDPDDIQSLIHALFYADVVDIEGIICGYPRGKTSAAIQVLKEYRKDYPKLALHGPYPTAESLARVVKPGSTKKFPSTGFSKPTAGSRHIIACARKADSRPLHVLCWGSATDLAQAIHDAPDIVPKIKAYCIGSWNEDQCPNSTKFLRKQLRLNWVDCQTTFRGMYLEGGGGKYGNKGFVEQVIKKAGHLGAYFHRMSAKINTGAYSIKMGDTPSFLQLLNPAWGGTFERSTGSRYVDSKNKKDKIGIYPGARTVQRHRRAILRDWEQRMKRAA